MHIPIKLFKDCFMAKNLAEALTDKKFKAEYNKLLPHQKKDVPGFIIMNMILKKLKKKQSDEQGQ